jgi:predicted aldo/keto reductase-like oxidoreductase
MKISRREFNKASLGAASLAALGAGNALAGPEHMIRKAIPSSGEMLPIVGLGTNRYGVDTSDAARAPLRAALKRFHEIGGTVIDTAPGYRTSESVFAMICSWPPKRIALTAAKGLSRRCTSRSQN